MILLLRSFAVCFIFAYMFFFCAHVMKSTSNRTCTTTKTTKIIIIISFNNEKAKWTAKNFNVELS